MRIHQLTILLGATLILGCGEPDEVPSPDEGLVDPSSDLPNDGLVAPSSGKDDSGFVSDRAVEFEGYFSSTVKIDAYDLPGDGDEQERLDALLSSTWELYDHLSEQIKYARIPLQKHDLHLNQSTSEVVEISGVIEDGEAVISYTAVVDTVVTFETLENLGGVEELTSRTFEFPLPEWPSDAGFSLLHDCTTQPNLDPEKVFYFYDPTLENCPEALDQVGRAAATYRPIETADVPTVYPEYDRLIEDGVLKIAVFFGAADEDWTVGDDDEFEWGVYQYDQFVWIMKRMGFEESEASVGTFLKRERDGLRQEIHVVGPDVLALLKDDDGLFTSIASSNEVVMYNGHSFYGTLDALRGPEAYGDHYQIFYFSSCWSYGHYATQPFRYKVTEEDPLGWDGVDVVVDNAPGWFHNMAPTSQMLVSNLLRGAETMGADDEGREFSWQSIIGAMNDYAYTMYRQRGTDTHELYGVTGARTNKFKP